MSPRAVLVIAIIANVLAVFAPEILLLCGVITLLAGPPGNDVPDAIRAVIMISCHLAGFVAWIGMLFCWNPARYFYIATWAIALFGTVVAGSGAFTAVGIALIMCLGFTTGFLLCYVFFGDGRHLFRTQRPNQALERTAGRSVESL
jgi:hypothetical protein